MLLLFQVSWSFWRSSCWAPSPTASLDSSIFTPFGSLLLHFLWLLEEDRQLSLHPCDLRSGGLFVSRAHSTFKRLSSGVSVSLPVELFSAFPAPPVRLLRHLWKEFAGAVSRMRPPILDLSSLCPSPDPSLHGGEFTTQFENCVWGRGELACSTTPRGVLHLPCLTFQRSLSPLDFVTEPTIEGSLSGFGTGSEESIAKILCTCFLILYANFFFNFSSSLHMQIRPK